MAKKPMRETVQPNCNGATEVPAERGNGNPGDILATGFMKPLGLTAYRLAKEIGVHPIGVSEILRGKRAISASMALRLGIYFGVDPGFWMELQAKHDLAKARSDGADSGITTCQDLRGRTFLIRQTPANNGSDSSWKVDCKSVSQS